MDLSPGDLPSGESTFGGNDLVPLDTRLVWTTKRQAIFRLLVRVGQLLCQIAVNDSTTVLTHWRSIKIFLTLYVLLIYFFPTVVFS